MLQDDFNQLMQKCKELNLIYIKDLLKWYNNLDVGPLLKACLKNKEFYYKFDLNMYKDGFTLPALAENIMFQSAQEDFKEYLKQEPDLSPSHCNIPDNIDKKIESYTPQDLKANRSLDNYIEKDEIIEQFKKQKHFHYYCWRLFTTKN